MMWDLVEVLHLNNDTTVLRAPRYILFDFCVLHDNTLTQVQNALC